MRKSSALEDVVEGRWILFPKSHPEHPLSYGRVGNFVSVHKADARRYVRIGSHESFVIEGETTVFDAVACDCYFCGQDIPHPERHKAWAYSTPLLVAESLSDNDRVKVRTCTTCGHSEQDPRV